jgi:large conductance mechanosensitive channel
MRGFRDFVLRGNLVELAVAFIMATAFTAVVTATVQVVMDVLGMPEDVALLSESSSLAAAVS